MAKLDLTQPITWRDPTQEEAVRFTMNDRPRFESDQSAAAKAQMLGNVYFDLLERAQRPVDPNMDDKAAQAEACYFSAALTGADDAYGTMWKKGGFKTGKEYLAYMKEFFKNAPSQNLTQRYRDFKAKDEAGQIAEAMEARKTMDKLKRFGGDVAETVGNVLGTGYNKPLSRAELEYAPQEVQEASAILADREAYAGSRWEKALAPEMAAANAAANKVLGKQIEDPHSKEEYEAASKAVGAWREQQYQKAVRGQYEAELLKENAWAVLSSIMPNLSGDGQICAQAIIDSKEDKLPETLYAKFNNLQEHEKQMLVRARQVLKPQVEGGFWNTVGDMGVGAANVGMNVITAPYRLGNKWGMMAFEDDFDVNELAKRRQYLYQVSGDFFAGGAEGGYLPQLQFENFCDDHGIIAEALIGAVSTLPYMAAAALPGIGTPIVAMEAMNQMDDYVALNGGDITDPGYLVRSAVLAAAYAYTERLQVEGLLGGISDQRLREATLKGFFAGVKDLSVPRVLVAGTFAESVQEGIQNGIMEVNNALALDQDAVRAFGEGFTEDFIGSLGTMFVVEAGGIVGAHAKRSGFNNPFSLEGRQAGQQARSRDFLETYGQMKAPNDMVEFADRTTEIQTEQLGAELARYGQTWRKGGKKALMRAGLDETRAEEWSYYFDQAAANAKKEGTPTELDERAGEALGDAWEYLAGKLQEASKSEKASDEEVQRFKESLQTLNRVRNLWARGAGVRTVDADGKVHDPGAKALEEMGFTPDVADELSKRFHYERAAAYSPAALAGIRQLYEAKMGDKVGAAQAFAQQFGAAIETIEGKDYIKFADKNGLASYVEIQETTLDEARLFGDEQANTVGVDIEKAQAKDEKGRYITQARWAEATAEQRKKWWALNPGLKYEGEFSPYHQGVKIMTGKDPSAQIDSATARKLIGAIRLVQDPGTGLKRAVEYGIADTSAGFHEAFHAFSYFAQANGIWTGKDIEYLQKTFGEKKATGETFDEEAGAEAFRSWVARRAAGELKAEDEKSPFMKLYTVAAGLTAAEAEESAKEAQAIRAEEAFFAQAVAEAQAAQAKPKEAAKPAETKAQEPAKPAESKPVKKMMEAPDNTWSAYTPTGNVKVGGHYEVLTLEEIIHSNKPEYKAHMRNQLRDRVDNKVEADKREEIAENLQPERLMESSDTANGAPIVFYDVDEAGVRRPYVLSGNGRVMVLESLAARHTFDKYRNPVKAWAEARGLQIPEGETPVLVRVIDDYGGATREQVADLSNTNAIQQYTEAEQAVADAEIVKSLDLAALYAANQDGTPNMTPGANDDFFREFIKATGDTSLGNSDRSIPQSTRERALRALLAVAAGQGPRGRETVKKLVEQSDTLGLKRQKEAVQMMAAPVARLERNPAYAIGPDVSRALADYMDYAERKKAGKAGTFEEYVQQEHLFDGPSFIAQEILKLLGSGQSPAAMAEYVRTYTADAINTDPAGDLLGAARTREEIWRDAATIAKENIAKQTRFAISNLYTGSAADYEKPSLVKVGTGEGAQVYGWGLYASNRRGVAEWYARQGGLEKANLKLDYFGEVELADILNIAKKNGRPIAKVDKDISEENLSIEQATAYYIFDEDSVGGAIQFVEKWIERLDERLKTHEDKSKEIETRKTKLLEILNELRQLGHEYTFGDENIYEQTWFTNRAPGDESHLLKWYEPVSIEQFGWIEKEWDAEKPEVTSKDAEEKLFAQLLDGADGQHVYGWLSEALGSPKAASEFLARAGIDGVKYPVDSYGKPVKDGDKVGWNYVSFRDDNIRVDHKWVDGQQRFSIAVNPHLREEIDKALAKQTDKNGKALQSKRHEDIVFSEHLPFFDFLGLPNLRVVTEVVKVRKFKAKHHLNEDQIASLPEHYNNPVAAIREDDNTFVLLTDLIGEDDHGNKKPVMVLLRRKTLKSGESLFIATALAKNAENEFDYYSPRIKKGLLFADENRIAGIMLGEETESILRTQASGDNVKNASDYSLWRSSLDIIPQTGSESQGGKAKKDPEAMGRQAIVNYARTGKDAAESALENYVAYFKLAHGSIPRDKTIAKLGLSLGMPTVSPKKILEGAERLADMVRGGVIEQAARNGDIGAAMAMIKQEKDALDAVVDNLIAGGVASGGKLTHKGVGAINSLLAKRVEQMMSGMDAATLADLERDTGLNLAAEILANNPDAFDTVYKKARAALEDKNAEENEKPDEGAGEALGDGGEISDYERHRRAQVVREANERVVKFIEAAKAQAQENAAKAKERREIAIQSGAGEALGENGAGDDEGAPGGAAQESGADAVTAGFKTPEEFAAFLRIWALHRFKTVQGHSTLAKAEQDRLFAEFYRITAKQHLQDLADKLLAPKDESGHPNAKLSKLGAGARVWVNRRLADLEKGVRPDTIERASAEIYAFINKAAVRVSRVELIDDFKKELKQQFLKDPKFDEFKQDTERKVTGWLEEACRYILQVCDLSRKATSGNLSELEKEYERLHDAINKRAKVYDESGKAVSEAEKEDEQTIRARWKLSLLDTFGGMRQLMPGEILDLRNRAFQYLNEMAEKLEQDWAETRERQEAMRRALAIAIQGPNGQKYQPKGIFGGKLFDALNGMIRLRLEHLTRFATEEQRAQAREAINDMLVMLGEGEVVFTRALQRDRNAFFEILAQIFRTPDGRADNAAIRRYLERLDRPIPKELAEKISFQGYADSMTYGQMLQLLVSLEQRSFKDAVKAQGREEHADLIRNFRYQDKRGNVLPVFTKDDQAFIDLLRQFYARKRGELSEVTMRMVGMPVESPDPLYMPVRRYMDDRTRGLHSDPTPRWDPISKIFSRRVENERDFDESRSITGLFFENSQESAKLVAWAERGSFIRNVVTSLPFQNAVKRAFGAGELSKILKQLEATFNGGETRSATPGELAAVDKAINFTTYAYLGFNPLSAIKQTTSFTVWANALPGGFRDLWRHMTHFDREALKHLMESEEFKVRYGSEVGGGMDYATKGLSRDPSRNPVARMFADASMWLLKKGDFVPGGWIAQGVYKDLLDRNLKKGMEFAEADKRAITETFNLLEETQQSGRTYNTNMLQIEHGRIGRLLVQFATSPLQQLQYETQAWREWQDLKRYKQDARKIAAARQRFWRAAMINHVLLPAALNLVVACYKAALGEEPPWEKDGWHWTLLIDLILGQFSRVFFLGAMSTTTLNALFKREAPRMGSMLPVEGAARMAGNAAFLLRDLAVMDLDHMQKDFERILKSAAPTRVPYNIYRRLTGDSDQDRKEKKQKHSR